MDTSLMINRRDKDTDNKIGQELKLNVLRYWLTSGSIDPQRAKEIIELYYKEIPF